MQIREQVIYDVAVKPYCSQHKIYIIPDAQMMTVQAQNALLKTIEEPPEYAVIMLLTSNVDGLLPTIQSRCVRLDLKVVDDSLVKQYLMERLHVPDYQAEIDASFAQGSIGIAKEAATSEEFSNITQNALKILKNADSMEVYELADDIKLLSAEKQNIGDYLDIFQFWFRDVRRSRLPEKSIIWCLNRKLIILRNRQVSAPMKIWKRSWKRWKKPKYVFVQT